MQGEEGNAFTKPMGSRGSVPHLLRLRPEDMAHTGSGKFTKVCCEFTRSHLKLSPRIHAKLCAPLASLEA
eukprot:1160065-Pelagomonas_calceolata.AAC.8